MSSSKNRSLSYLAIALAGFGMIGLPLYAEFPGDAVDSFNYKEYLYVQVRPGLWWQMFAIPVLAGVFFVLMAAFAPRMKQKFASDLPMLGACVLLSGTLAILVKGYVLIAFVVSCIILTGELATVLRQHLSRDNP